jgi:PAS domain S-box-containing protein
VNAPALGRLLGKILVAAPVLVIVCLSPRLFAVFKPELLFVLAASCLSYLCYGLMLNTVTRFREEYIIERERAETLKVESEVLESISDCFISLDSHFSLVYLNDAACAEFSVERHLALKATIPDAVPAFFSTSMIAELQAASRGSAASMFEAPNQKQDAWYEMRCFPRPDGMSIYFRNITESMSSRRKLEEAHGILREQAELLDKAQDAIVVQDMNHRIIYWNKGAERLYGWAADEATGRCAQDIGDDSLADRYEIIGSVLQHDEWTGELSQRRRDGSIVVVESRCTLVRADDGSPRSILAINTDITNRKSAEAKISGIL